MITAQHNHDRRAAIDVVAGYGELAAQRVADGWMPSLVTLLFSPVPGRPEAVLAQMFNEAERDYRTFITRVARRPLSPRSQDSLPVLIIAPDLPVGKTGKPLADVAVNDGLHLHGVLLVPPRSRLPLPVDEHFRQNQVLYLESSSKPDGLDGPRPSRLVRIDVRPIDGPVEPVVTYALKSVARHRFTPDDVLVLPRALAEVRNTI